MFLHAKFFLYKCTQTTGLQLITTSVGETWASKSKDSAVTLSSMQWWIQDFKEGWGEGAIPKVGRGCQPII